MTLQKVLETCNFHYRENVGMECLVHISGPICKTWCGTMSHYSDYVVIITCITTLHSHTLTPIKQKLSVFVRVTDLTHIVIVIECFLCVDYKTCSFSMGQTSLLYSIQEH